MNNFINWVAVNNTLMIRIGFTAILALLVIYVFRLFFLPKVSVVNDPADSANPNSAKADGILDEDELEKRKIVEQKQAEYYTTEIEKLLIEVARLKDQLMDTNTLVTDLKEKNLDLTNQLKNAVVETPVTTEAVDPEIVTGLKSKVESLEARLAEYEIIAEDISEIGQLRKELVELRKQAEKVPEVADEIPEYEPEPEPPVAEDAPVERLDEAQIADLILAMEANTSDSPDVEQPVAEDAKPEEPMIEDVVAEEIKIEESVAVSPVRLVGDKEVSASERDMLDHFEEISKKKGS